MTGAILAELLLKFGPIAFDYAVDLAKIWTKTMTPEEVETFCKSKRQSYDDFIAQERASRIPPQ